MATVTIPHVRFRTIDGVWIRYADTCSSTTPSSPSTSTLSWPMPAEHRLHR
jgi:hypothetical protein